MRKFCFRMLISIGIALIFITGAKMLIIQQVHAAGYVQYNNPNPYPTPDFSQSTIDCSSATLQGSGNPGGECEDVPLSSLVNDDTMQQIDDLAQKAMDVMQCRNDIHEVKEQWVGPKTILYLTSDFWNDCGATIGGDIKEAIETGTSYVIEVLP